MSDINAKRQKVKMPNMLWSRKKMNTILKSSQIKTRYSNLGTRIMNMEKAYHEHANDRLVEESVTEDSIAAVVFQE